MVAYEYACKLRSEAENEFLPEEFGRDYAEGILFNEDPSAIDFTGNLTKESIDELWYGEISPPNFTGESEGLDNADFD